MDKLNIGLLRKIRMKADILPNLLPASAKNGEGPVRHKDDKMWIANRYHHTLNLLSIQIHAAQSDSGCWTHPQCGTPEAPHPFQASECLRIGGPSHAPSMPPRNAFHCQKFPRSSHPH